MARITLGIGTSHSPILVLDGDRWEQRAQDDRRQTALYTLDGRKCSYDQLLAERGEPFRQIRPKPVVKPGSIPPHDMRQQRGYCPGPRPRRRRIPESSRTWPFSGD